MHLLSILSLNYSNHLNLNFFADNLRNVYTLRNPVRALRLAPVEPGDFEFHLLRSASRTSVGPVRPQTRSLRRGRRHGLRSLRPGFDDCVRIGYHHNNGHYVFIQMVDGFEMNGSAVADTDVTVGPSTSSVRSNKRRVRGTTSRTVTLQMLLETNILEPGDSVLSLEYMVTTTPADKLCCPSTCSAACAC